ncbi:YdcF family protein [Leptothermofonsia sp. ETS-13]|uniref:YdcF family protein n=1 Tax=Leptothermofonsia sp. ETS-13 TaxID=3035696 RepID=UPI003BA2A132
MIKALILLALLWILWLVSSRRWRRWLLRPFAILVVSFLIITSPVMVALATWSLTFSLPADTGEPVDSIVVLGRGEALRNWRVEVADQLWENHRADKIFVSGMSDAREIIDLLEDRGVSESALSGERCSESTEENALYSSAILYPQGIQKILLVTDSPHMLRSLLSFQRAGFQVIPHPSQLPSQWSTQEQISLIAREYLGLAQYTLTGRFKPRSTNELEHVPAKTSKRLSDPGCKVQAK